MVEIPTYEELSEKVKELQQSLAFYRSLVDNTQDLLYRTDLDGRISYISPSVYRLSGYTVEEAIGMRMAEEVYLNPEERKGFLAKLRDKGRVTNFEVQLKRKDGSVWWASTNAHFYKDREGNIIGVEGTTRDITERKQMEEDLRDSESRLKALSEASFEAIFLSEKGVCLDQNNTAEEMFGYTHAEAIGMPGTEWIVPEDRDQVQSNMLSGYQKPYKVSAKRKDGTTFPCEIQARMLDYQGRSIRVTALRDLSERKQVEEALRKSEERFSLAMEASKDGLWDWDLTTGDIYCSPGLTSMIGYDSTEVLQNVDEWQDLIHPEDWQKAYQANLDCVNNLTDSFEIEYRMKTRDGGFKWILGRGKAVYRDASGKALRMIGTHQDITDRKHAEEKLQKSEERYRGVVEDQTELISRFKNDGTLTWMNEFAAEYAGQTVEQLIGRSFFDFLSPEEREKAIEDLAKITPDNPVVESTQQLALPTGEKKWIQWRNRGIFDSQGAVIEYQGVGRDITERLKLEEELRQSHKMESIGILAGGIAHDFNNILSSIIGFTELALDETSKGTTIEDSLQEVYSAGKRAKDLVKQILAFARQSEEKVSPIKPSVVAKEVIKFIRSTIPTTIEIQQEIKGDALIMGNTTQVHQVLMNLCTNAAHAMEDTGGVLSVNLKEVFLNEKALLVGMKPGEYSEIKVSDTGVGIAPENIDSIFEPYYTTKGFGEGTGMGLAMVQGVVESYGGKIAVRSRLGKGTTFTIHLPVTKKRSTQDAYVAEKLPKGTEHILLVDDEASIAKMGGQILERLGYEVTTRTSSIEALELFQAKPNDFDLVITDMTMPNLTGDKLAIELMKIRYSIPVILCTGYSKKISDESATEIGIKAFAYKPIVKADLAKTVRNVLDDAKPES